MAEVATTFYANVFENASRYVTERAIPCITKYLMREIDAYILRVNEGCFGNGGGGQRLRRRDNNHQSVIENRNLNRILEVFGERSRESRRFCEIFPRLKENRLAIIAALNSVAEELQDSKCKSDKVNMAGNVLGLGGGLLRAASMLQPLLPSWVKIVGNSSSALGNSIKAGNNLKAQMCVEKCVSKAKNYINSDREHFNCMLRWFEYDDDLTDSIAVAIGTDTMKTLFETFQSFYDQVREFNENNPEISGLTRVLWQAAELITGHDFTGRIIYAGALFQIFLVHYADRNNCDWIDAAKRMERLKTGCMVSMYAANAALSAQQLRNEEWNVPAVSYVGIAVDVVPAFLSYFDDGSSSQSENVRNVVDKLNEELSFFETVYNELKERETTVQPLPVTMSRRRSF